MSAMPIVPHLAAPCEHCFGVGTAVDQRQLGADLRRYREWHEATQTDVAAELGLSKSYVCDLELGRRDWRPELVGRFKNAVLHVGKG